MFVAIDQVVQAKGIAVDFKKLRHGRRLLAHQNQAKRSQRRQHHLKHNNNLDDIEGLHPRCKQYIIDLTNE